jgi:hypothetical protein
MGTAGSIGHDSDTFPDATTAAKSAAVSISMLLLSLVGGGGEI